MRGGEKKEGECVCESRTDAGKRGGGRRPGQVFVRVVGRNAAACNR